jgi:hypothetical protein
MNVTSAGIASSWAATRADSAQQAVEIAMLKQQATAEQGVVQLMEVAVETAKTPAPPPPGQGRHVDVQA